MNAQGSFDVLITHLLQMKIKSNVDWVTDDGRIIFDMHVVEGAIWLNLDTWMNGWFQPQRFTRTLFTTDIFGSCSRNALDWKHRVGREQAISPALFHTAWLSAVISLSIASVRASIVDCVTALWHARLPRFRSELQRCIALSVSLQARYYAPNSGAG